MSFLSDIGNAISSVASAVGDVVEDVVDAVVDTVEDAVDFVVDAVNDGVDALSNAVCGLGSIACGIANVIGGAVKGVVNFINDVVHDIADIVRDLGQIIGAILRLDIPGLLEAFGGLVMDILDLIVDVGRFIIGGYIVGGIVDRFKQSSLRNFVEDLVVSTFDDEDILRTVRATIGLDGSQKFGFRLPSEHRIFVLDSNDVDLATMHNTGVIDLFSSAHLLSFQSFALGAAHPNSYVKQVNEDGTDSPFPVTRLTIAKFLEQGGGDIRLRVIAMDRRTIQRNIDTASRHMKKMAVVLNWNDSTLFSWFNQYTRQNVTDNDYNISSEVIETMMARDGFNRDTGDNCSLLTLGAFVLDNFGRVGGRDIASCNEQSAAECGIVPDRDDGCCNIINNDVRSGVIYRDAYPSDVMQYVLAHEIGHFMGLCHCQHDGFQNIMFSGVQNSPLDIGLLNFYLESEPSFTLRDAENCWRFIVSQMRTCLTGVAAPPTLVARLPLSVQRSSCCVPPEMKEKKKEG